ncbi:hypothetical protein B0E38_07906 [Streptomyces sp. 111WW2]|nr:hypothetical protein B0E38_07906 [Streptomyces sp. 111WW2]
MTRASRSSTTTTRRGRGGTGPVRRLAAAGRSRRVELGGDSTSPESETGAGPAAAGPRWETSRPDTSRPVCHSAKSDRPSSSARRFSSALRDWANSRIRTGSLAVRCVVTCGTSVHTCRPSPRAPPELTLSRPSMRTTPSRSGRSAEASEATNARSSSVRPLPAGPSISRCGPSAARSARTGPRGPAPSTACARPPRDSVSSAAAAQRAIREAGVARARPSSSRSRAVRGSGADTRAWCSPPSAALSVRSGARARANRSAQGRDTASTVQRVP